MGLVTSIRDRGCRVEVQATRETLRRIGAVAIEESDPIKVREGPTDRIGDGIFKIGRP